MALHRAPDQFSPRRRGAATTPTCGGCCCCCCVGSVIGTSIALPIAILKTDEKERKERSWSHDEPVAPRPGRVRAAAIQASLALLIGTVAAYGALTYLVNAKLLGAGIALVLGYIVAFFIVAFAIRRARITQTREVSNWLVLFLALWVVEAALGTWLIFGEPQPLLRAIYIGIVLATATIIPVVAWHLHSYRVNLRNPIPDD